MIIDLSWISGAGWNVESVGGVRGLQKCGVHASASILKLKLLMSCRVR
jgi:hypothetical protein